MDIITSGNSLGVEDSARHQGRAVDTLKKSRKQADHREAVLGALRRAKRPIGAYEVIAQLRGEVDLAPPTVYRILDRLIAAGLAHKVQSLNAFVSCSHREHPEDAAFAICNACGSVTEFCLPKLGQTLSTWSRRHAFTLDAAVIELHGTCADCHAREQRN